MSNVETLAGLILVIFKISMVVFCITGIIIAIIILFPFVQILWEEIKERRKRDE